MMKRSMGAQTERPGLVAAGERWVCRLALTGQSSFSPEYDNCYGSVARSYEANFQAVTLAVFTAGIVGDVTPRSSAIRINRESQP